MVLWGYSVPADQYESALQNLKSAVGDPSLPSHEVTSRPIQYCVRYRSGSAEKRSVIMGSSETCLSRALLTSDAICCACDHISLPCSRIQFEEALSVLSGRLEQKLFNELKGLADAYKDLCSKTANSTAPVAIAFPAAALLSLLDQHSGTLSQRSQDAFSALTSNLRSIVELYTNGLAGRAMHTLLTLVRLYTTVERGFTGSDMEGCVRSLKKTHAGELSYVYDMCQSHLAMTAKNTLLLKLLEEVSQLSTSESGM